MTDRSASLLATGRGKLLLLLLCAVQFLDVVDSSIMNVALPSIRRDLGFSAQDLQWVLSGYLVTYGGLLLGTALGLAIFSAIASARTATLLGTHATPHQALTAGFHRALLACAFFLLAAAVIALRATNSRGEPAARPAVARAVRDQVPAPELAD